VAAVRTMEKSLDIKLAKLREDPGADVFILADAKDADMAYGMASGGKSPEHHAHEGRFRTLQAYREQIAANVKQGLVDIMLMSASTSDVLTIKRRLFDGSHVTPAIRANDTTDIWLAEGGSYREQPSRPFRTATIDHAMCGHLNCSPDERSLGADLGLYSVTFNNDFDRDYEAVQRYKEFRIEAESKGFRHFLEVFEPNQCGGAPGSGGTCPADIARFINDNIARTLAGVPEAGRPKFLKIPYLGPAAMEQLCQYDRSLVVGILGGSSGTTMDAFHQLWEAKKHGARVALYGRMINNAEHQASFIQHLRWIADGELDDPAAAVRSYHAALGKLDIQPYRPLDHDLRRTLRDTAYGGGAAKPRTAPPAGPPAGAPTARTSTATAPAGDAPNFSKMTPAEKIAWNRARWDRILG